MINKCTFIGNLGADPETRFTQDGTAVCTFKVACSEKWKDKSGNVQEKTEWVPIVAWARLAEICQEYLQKGVRVYIEGKYQTRKYQDQSGNDRWTTEIVAREMKMLGPRQGQSAPPEDNEDQYGRPPVDTGDDVPF